MPMSFGSIGVVLHEGFVPPSVAKYFRRVPPLRITIAKPPFRALRANWNELRHMAFLCFKCQVEDRTDLSSSQFSSCLYVCKFPWFLSLHGQEFLECSVDQLRFLRDV